MTFDANGFVLIVDDTSTNLAVISETLSHAGLEISVATSGERALKQIERRSPDLVLLDIMMPGIDGFETCRRLKADARYCDIPIIFMTALADTNSKVKGFEIGAVDYITKPFQAQEVLARVNNHLKLRRTQGQLLQSEARLENILNSLDEIVWSATLNPLQFLQINPVVQKIYGYSVESMMGNSRLWLDSVHPEDREPLEQFLAHPQEGQQYHFEYRISTAQGSLRWLQTKAQVRHCTQQEGYVVDGITHDISDRKQAESQLQYTACHDDLTGLFNRNYFLEAVNARLAEAAADTFAVLFIDLDRFKTVNDSLGHQCGDQLLVKISEILKQSIRPVDVVARLGGDEFTILLRSLRDQEEAQLIIRRIQNQLKQPIELGAGLPVSISASIGIVMGTDEYFSAHELLRDADIAMYQAKKLGKACHQLFSEEMYQMALEKINLECDLRAAIDSAAGENTEQAAGKILLHYQPIGSLRGKALMGFEALVRWQHPVRGLIPPDDFIPVAEESGLIVPLGEQILRQALCQLQQWRQSHSSFSNLTISINLSPRQLQEPGFLDLFDQLLVEYQLPPSALKLEITESLLMQGGEVSQEILNQLRSRGCSLSLDDFGTGYSSLSYLHQFPISTIKIDRSFIQALEPGMNSFEIVRAITQLAHNLNMDVIAEGVETPQQSEQLESLHCEMVQGYLLSKPLDAQSVKQYLGILGGKVTQSPGKPAEPTESSESSESSESPESSESEPRTPILC